MDLKKFNQREIVKIINTYFLSNIDDQKAKEYLAENNYKAVHKKNNAGSKNTEKAKFSDIQKDFSLFVADKILSDINEDVKFIAQKDPVIKSTEDILSAPSIGLLATVYYRIANFFVVNQSLGREKNNLKDKAMLLSQHALLKTSIDINPFAKIGVPLFIDHGYGVVIGETSVIGSRCTIFNGVILGSKNVVAPASGKRHPTLKDNVTICANAKILGDITIGNNVFVSPSAIVLDNIEDNHEVLIINQLQIEKRTTYSYLPSQQLVVYGIVPKFKNGINILGEGFYNPTVIIKLKNGKELNYEITYWEKNKIMIKFKTTQPLDKSAVKGAKLIVFSNSNRVVVLGNLALEKALTTLSD